MAPGATAAAMTSKSGAADAKRSKRNLLEDSDSDSDDGGTQIETSGFKVNEEYAKRFEHNKKREERHRCKSEQTPCSMPCLCDRR